MNSSSRKGISSGIALVLVLFALLAGIFIGSKWTAGGGSAGLDDAGALGSKEQETLYWVAPMDASYRRDKPGKSPMGMDLVPVYANESGPDNDMVVRINPGVEQNLGVRTQAAEIRSLFRRVDATGFVGFDESLVSQINMRTEGWVERLLVETEGEQVSKGQLLFEFYSPQLVNAQKEYIQAKRRNEAQLLKAATAKLLALGMVRSDIERLSKSGKVSNTIQVLAPRDGIVINLNAREGMFVKPATEVMSLVDLSSVWLQAEVFESQADWVARGQSVEARLNYMPGEVFSGRVDYVYPVLNPATRTLQVRLRFNNSDGRLKPNMYARVTIYGKTRPSVLSIPREALIRGPEIDRVVVALGAGRYQVREIMRGIESGNWVEIIAGLEKGDEVVTSAQFLIDSEASMRGSVLRLGAMDMDHGKSGPVSAFGSGIVDAVDLEARHLRVSHGPIDDLGWTAMTMEFDVLPGVELEKVKAGKNIHFSIVQNEVGDYVIDTIHLVDPPGAAEEGGDEEVSKDNNDDVRGDDGGQDDRENGRD
jgi:Cu(I)/Ag(I) efflux system membrane fusion protein